MLTDTSFWIALARERQSGRSGRATAFIAAHRAVELRISLVAWGELAEGFDSEEQMDRALRRVRVLPLSRHVAWRSSRLQRHLRGRRLGENDAWIAATALSWGLPFVTDDEDFDRVPSLRVVRF